MTTNAQTRAEPGAAAAPRRRLGWVVAALLLLLAAGGGAGAGVWWVLRHPSGPGDGDDAHGSGPPPAVEPGQVCSDDDDPKYLEHLDFGPPVETHFDRARLDALPGKPIPEVEKYPWQPAELVAVLGEHRMRGQVVVGGPDGRWLAVGSPGSGYLRIGPTETVHEQTILVCPGGVFALALAPDGATLAVSCGDGVVRLFDVHDIDKIPDPVALDKAAALVRCLAYSADGKYLLGGGDKPADTPDAASVWDAATRKIVNTLPHAGQVRGVAFSPTPGDYRALTGGGPDDGQLHLWTDAVKGNQQTAIDFRGKLDKQTYVGQVAFSPDGKQAGSAHWDADTSDGKQQAAVVRLWDLSRLTLNQQIHAYPGHVLGVAPVFAYSPDGRYLATGRYGDGGVWLWNAENGGQVRRLATVNGVNDVRFLGKGDRVAVADSVSNDWNVHIYEPDTGKELRPPFGNLSAVSCVAFAPDGRNVASGGQDLWVRSWDLGSLVDRPTAVGGAPTGVGFTPDAKAIYCYGANWATLPIIDVESGQPRTPAYSSQHTGGVLSAAISRDGRYALTGGWNDGTVRMWRLSDGRQVRLFDLSKGQGTAVATLSPNMRRAVAVVGGKTLLLHLRCQHVLHEWPGATAWAPFLPDGRVAFFGGADGPVWDLSGDEPKEGEHIPLNLGGTAAPVMSGDAKRVAGTGAKVMVFSLDTGKPMWEWTPPLHFGGVAGVALSPDGRDLLTANGDGTVYVIRLP